MNPNTFTIPKTGGVTTPATSFDIFTPAKTGLDFSYLKPAGPTLPQAQASQANTTAKATTLASTTNSSAGSTKNVVASSDSAINNENTIKSDVAKLFTTINNSNPTTTSGSSAPKTNVPVSSTPVNSSSIFDDYAAKLAARRTAETESINAAFSESKRQTGIAQNKETESTKTALTRIGGYLGGSASAIGALNNLAETHRLDLSALEAKRVAAIQAANNAIDDQEFKVAQAKAAEAKAMAKQIDDRNQQFFDNALKLTQESRLQSNSSFSQSLDIVDRIAPTIFTSIQGMSPDQASQFISQAANTLKIDPNILLGKVNSIEMDNSEKARNSIVQLAAKYPSANIVENDTLEQATAKVRGSTEYKLDIAKSEADLNNTLSLINDRAEQVNYASPILKLYTEVTGEVVSSPSTARAVSGYAESILSGKEIVADDYTGTLNDSQIKASDAKKQIGDAFASLNKKKGVGELADSTVWQWMGTPEAQEMDDDDKKLYIMQAGKNPIDFGIY